MLGQVGADLMTSNRWTPTLLTLALGAAGGVVSAEAAEFQCRNGDLVRRIEVSGTDAAQDASCEVRYWRNAATADRGRSLWRADHDPAYCVARARELMARLESEGWRCTSSEPAMQAGDGAAGPVAHEEPSPAEAPAQLMPAPESGARNVATAAEAPSPVVARTAPSAMPAAPPPSSAVAETASSGTPATPPKSAVAQTAPAAAPATASPSPALAQTAPLAMPPIPPWPAVAQPAPAAGPAPPASPDVAQTASPQSGRPPPAVPAHPSAALLDRVVEQTLRSVQELYGGQFEADVAAFGDLDRDGLEDAAVLVTYQADRKEHVQYLVAYLFNGETFRSVATKNVGGRFLDAVRADLQDIVDGRILVELEALDGGASCCARHRTAFALENGQLVQVADPDAAGLERTSQTERPAKG
jgi:hypothetical protein